MVRKSGIFLAVTFVLCPLFSISAQDATTDQLLSAARAAVRAVSIQELKKMIDSKQNVIILDVRDMKEYMDEHIPGAVNMSRASSMAPRLLEHHLEKTVPDKSANIVVYCMFATRAPLAAKTMKEIGYTNVSYMEGGLRSWKEAGYPVEK